MTALRICDLSHVSRANLYRFHPDAGQEAEEDLDLRDDIQRIALKFPYYGRPRITAELKRRGWEVNHKRVGRLCGRIIFSACRGGSSSSRHVSKHGFRSYPNLARGMKPTGVNQLWRAGITYIRLERSLFIWQW